MEKRFRVITSMIVITLFSSMLLGSNKKIASDDSVQNDKLWTLKWSDEFSGDRLNTNYWNYEIGNGNGGWGNKELEYYTDSDKNVFVDKTDNEAKDGKLVIKAIKETLPGVTQEYTSGRIQTKGKVSMKYGRLDIKAKLPVGDGIWPALWMMPVNDKYGGWAASGEIDMMEAKGRIPNSVYGTLHYGQTWPNNKYSGQEFVFPQGQTINQYHVYSLEWEPGEIRWYVDGKLYQKQNNWFTKGTNGDEKYSFPAPFDQDFFIIMNLAVGGTFDDKADLTKAQFPAQMDVDYVRVYDLTGRSYKTPVEPKIAPEAIPENAKQPDENGNLLSNGNFSKDIVDNFAGANDFGTDWNFVHIATTGGNGTHSIDTINGKNYAKINVTEPGSQDYAVQLIQRTTMVKGRWYKLAFDAKANSARRINVKASGGEDRGYNAYSDVFSYNLNKSMKHFESVFQMTQNTDLKGRLEFELGLKASTVWIGNVSLVEIPEPIIDYNASKNPLPISGNFVYNGAFDKGLVNRMTYWNVNVKDGAEASVYVPKDTRELNAYISNAGSNTSSITLDQKGIQLKKNYEYTLSFKARAAASRSIKVKLSSKDGTSDYVTEKNIDLTTEMKTYEVPFTMNTTTDLESQLVFLLGGNTSKVFIDDVSLITTTIDYSEIDVYPLKNGNFEQGLAGWETYKQGTEVEFSIDNGAAKISATTLGTEPYHIMLMQNGMNFTKGMEYTLSFKAKSSVDRDILVTLENDSYARTFDSSSLALTSEWKDFSYTVKPTVTEPLGLKFQLGKTSAGVPADIYIDDVVLQVKNPPVKQAPMLIADDTDNLLGNSIDITTADNSAWRSAITAVKIDDTAVASDKYTVTAGNINLAASNFTEPGEYTVTVEADGYAPTSVIQKIMPNDGKIVANGTFDTNTDNWTVYKGDGSNAVVTTNNGELKVNFPNYDGWFRWSTQIYQTGIKLQAGKTYILKFDARSTIGKNVLVEINKNGGGNHFATPEVALATSNNTFTYEFKASESDTNAKLNFLLGSNNVPGENFVTHSIFLDNVSITEKLPIVNNGTFDTNSDGWTVYKGDGSNAAVTAVNGELKVDFPNYDGWFRWSTQVYQTGIKIEAGKTYVLKFDARSTIAKNILVEINKNGGGNHFATPEIALAASNKTFTYEFTPATSDTNAKLNFLLGSNNVPGENFVTHTILLDNVSIEEKTGGNSGSQSSVITVEAETGTLVAEGANAIGVVEGTAVKATAPTNVEFSVNLPQAGTYKVTFVGKCSPAGINYILKNSAGAVIVEAPTGPSNTYTSDTVTTTLSAGNQTFKVFIAPGGDSTAYLDKITFEKQ